MKTLYKPEEIAKIIKVSYRTILDEISSKCEFVRISNSSPEESYVNNTQVTREAQN